MAVRKRTYVDFTQVSPVGMQDDGTVLSAVDNETNIFMFNGVSFESYNEGTMTNITLAKRSTSGWTVPDADTDNVGVELTQGVIAAGPAAFTIGTDPAFKVSVKFLLPVVATYDVAAIGFRKVAAYDTALDTPGELLTAYSDVALLNVNAGTIATNTRLAAGVGTVTSTTNTWADAASKTLTVLVSAAGVATFLIDGAAPTVNTNTVTLTSGVTVVPTIIFRRAANTGSSTPILSTYFCGYQ